MRVNLRYIPDTTTWVEEPSQMTFTGPGRVLLLALLSSSSLLTVSRYGSAAASPPPLQPPSPLPPSPPTQIVYVGCYSHVWSQQPSALQYLGYVWSADQVGACAARAEAAGGLAFFALEAGSQCWGSQDYSQLTSAGPAAPGACDQLCGGAGTYQLCGGNTSFSVYISGVLGVRGCSVLLAG